LTFSSSIDWMRALVKGGIGLDRDLPAGVGHGFLADRQQRHRQQADGHLFASRGNHVQLARVRLLHEFPWPAPIRRLVSPDMADGTTTIWCPASCHLATRRATFLMRSVEPIDVPPYLWTIKAITVSFPLK
jgi:hypothetical protein